MEYLVVETSEDEVFYKLTEVSSISYDFAENVLNESEMAEKDVKPLERVAVIAFENGFTEVFSTVGLKMHFD